jgi:hypothetical protein
MRGTTLLLSVVVLVLASCSAGTETTITTATTTPEATASPESAPSGLELSDLVGTWKGQLIQPEFYATWRYRVTIQQCDEADDSCGHIEAVTGNWNRTGNPERCGLDITYSGFREDLRAFAFTEDPRSGRSEVCVTALLGLTPLSSGQTLGAEVYYRGTWLLAYGYLHRTSD